MALAIPQEDLFCFEFQIASRTKPSYRFALFSKHYSKTFRALPDFLAHKFSKFSTDISISKNNTKTKKRIQRGNNGNSKRILSASTLFRLFSLLSSNYDSSSSNMLQMDDIKVIWHKFITFDKRNIRYSDKCKYNISE